MMATVARVDCKYRYHNNTTPLVGIAVEGLKSQRREFVSGLNPSVKVSLTSGSIATYANFSTFHHDLLQPSAGAADSADSGDDGALNRYPGGFSAVLGAFVNSKSPDTINVVECAIHFDAASQKGSPAPEPDPVPAPAAGSRSAKPSHRPSAASRSLYGRGETGNYRFSFYAVRSFDVTKNHCSSSAGAALLAGNVTAETLAKKLESLLQETAALMAPSPSNLSPETTTLPFADSVDVATATATIVVIREEVVGIYVPASPYFVLVFPVLAAILLAGRYAAAGRRLVTCDDIETVAELEAKDPSTNV